METATCKTSKVFLWRQRVGYGAADFACNLVWQMISLYLLYYYTDIAGLSGFQIATMFVICRIIDGITDLLKLDMQLIKLRQSLENLDPIFCGVQFLFQYLLI